jgi:Zn-dependent protease
MRTSAAAGPEKTGGRVGTACRAIGSAPDPSRTFVSGPMLASMGTEGAQPGVDRQGSIRDVPAASFRVGPIPVRIEIPFVLIALLLGFRMHTSGLLLTAWVAVVLFSLLFHELAHAAVTLAFGGRVRVVLNAMGGQTYASEPPASALRDAALGLAGPAAQIVFLGLPALALARSGMISSPTMQTIVRDTAWVSLCWAGISLLPVLPLDGGRITATLLRRVEVAESGRLARVVSVGTALGLSVWAWHNVGAVGGLLALYFASWNALGLRRATDDAWSKRRSLRASANVEESHDGSGDDAGAPSGRPRDLRGD